MDEETRELLKLLRLRLKAGKGLLRDLQSTCSQLEDRLQALEDAQPEEAQRNHEHSHRTRLVAA